MDYSGDVPIWEREAPYSYTNWAPNQPDVDDGESVMAQGTAAKWYLTNCDDSRNAICEKEPEQ